MRFLRDLYRAAATGFLLGAAIGIYRRRARERREAQARPAQTAPTVTPAPRRPRRQGGRPGR
jgi:hypothetical protein